MVSRRFVALATLAIFLLCCVHIVSYINVFRFWHDRLRGMVFSLLGHADPKAAARCAAQLRVYPQTSIADDAKFLIESKTISSSQSRIVIINASLVVVEDNFVDGWAVKGSDIIALALLTGDTSSYSITLYDAHGAAIDCSSKQQLSSQKVTHHAAIIVCPFISLRDLNARMQLTSATTNQTACMCCSVAKKLVFRINSKYFYLQPLIRFPNANIAIILPVIYGDVDPISISRWLSHATLVLGLDTVIVYSRNSTETFDQTGILRPFYSLNSAKKIVIVDISQIQGLHTHYYGQQFAINDAFLRGIGAVEYLGSFDADEFLEIPSGVNITAFLRKKFCNQVSSACINYNYAAMSIGSFMVLSYSSNITHEDLAYFCTTGLLRESSSLSPEAECYNDMEPKLPPEVFHQI
jgi:hypothetical protein